MECMQLLKTLGIDVIRLRVWVNPGTRYNGTADVVAKAEQLMQTRDRASKSTP